MDHVDPPPPAYKWPRRIFVGVLLVLAVVVNIPLAWFGFSVVYAWGAGRLWDRAQHEIHLVPQDFVGPVVILLDQRDGEAQSLEGRARLYRVPASGVLRTKWGFNDGWGAPEWYFVDSTGTRTPIVGGAQCLDSLPEKAPRACWLGQKLRSDRAPVARYSGYLISRGPPSQDLWRRADSLVDAVVFNDP